MSGSAEKVRAISRSMDPKDAGMRIALDFIADQVERNEKDLRDAVYNAMVALAEYAIPNAPEGHGRLRMIEAHMRLQKAWDQAR